MEFARLSGRYAGETAEAYDSRREQTERWAREQKAVETILRELPHGLAILDVPVGTGRFIELYQQLGMQATGIDISLDMLAQAKAKAERANARFDLREGDIRALALPGQSFDVVLCVRFLNWIDVHEVRDVLSKLARVSSRYLVISASHFTPLPEINLLSRKGLRSLAGQAARRFKTQVARGGRKRRIVFHEKSSLMAVLAESGLTIAEAICTEPGARGVQSYIYLLEKTGSRR